MSRYLIEIKVRKDILKDKFSHVFASHGDFDCFSGPNLIKLLGAYLGANLSQINRVRHLNKRLKVL